MSINLSKGQKVKVGKTNVTVGLGWTPNEGTGKTFDLDCSVFLLNGSRMIPTEQDFVFYNNKVSPDGAVTHSGDNLTGAGDGDDEQVIVDITKLKEDVKEILFVVTINDCATKGQNFGQVKDAYIRIIDNATGTEIMKYDLGEDFSIETAIEFGKLYEKDGEWKFDATGVGFNEELAFFVSKYATAQVVR